MEAFFIVLALVAIAFTLALIVFASRHGKRSDENLPPGSLGWPIIGETFDFLLGKMANYSPDIFKTRILGEDTAVICGPSRHKFLFTNEQRCLTAFRPHSMQTLFRSYKKAAPPPPPVPSVQPAKDEEVKILRSPGFLKPEALVRYLGKMDSITRQQIHSEWEGKKEVRVYPLAESLTLTLACQFFLDTNEPEWIARLKTVKMDIYNS